MLPFSLVQTPLSLLGRGMSTIWPESIEDEEQSKVRKTWLIRTVSKFLSPCVNSSSPLFPQAPSAVLESFGDFTVSFLIQDLCSPSWSQTHSVLLPLLLCPKCWLDENVSP